MKIDHKEAYQFDKFSCSFEIFWCVQKCYNLSYPQQPSQFKQAKKSELMHLLPFDKLDNGIKWNGREQVYQKRTSQIIGTNLFPINYFLPLIIYERCAEADQNINKEK